MTSALAIRRRGQAAWMIALATLALVAAFLAYGAQVRGRAPPTSPGLAAPALTSTPVEELRIQTREGSFRLVRDPKGGWAMRDRGGYPVRQDAVEQFLAQLSDLSFGQPKTRDPAKHAKLALDDPRQGGGAALVQARGPNGALLADVLVGRVGDTLYLRAAGDPQTWTAKGSLPPARDASAWLDLRPFTLAPERVARVDVLRADGAYALVRRSEERGGGFALAPPLSTRPVRDPARLARVAQALAAVDPLDVTTAPAVSGAPEARVTLQTFDGVRIDAELFRRPDRAFVKVTAQAQAPEAATEVATINRRAGPWAFALDPKVAADIAPPLAELIPMPTPPTAQAVAEAPSRL